MNFTYRADGATERVEPNGRHVAASDIVERGEPLAKSTEKQQAQEVHLHPAVLCVPFTREEGRGEEGSKIRLAR